MWKIKRSTRFVQVALIPVLLIGWAMLFACGYSLMFNESLQL